MNKKLKVFLGSALIGGMLLSIGNFVFAQNSADDSATSEKTAVTENAPFRGGMWRHRGKAPGMRLWEDILTELSEKGIITIDQVEKIKEYVEQKREQEREQFQQERRQQIESTLQTLVEKGTITAEKKQKILAYLDEREKEREQEIEKIRNMTEEERKAYFEAKKNSESNPRKNLIQELVDKGILTEDEAKAVAQAIRPNLPALKK
ncbi:MAG: hypothetical protein PWP45_734 [Tepidanaerobacteraceae bacterium]|nr:hypothetical protein [Tepidanaerobacteraceae bacterium]